MTAPSSDRFAGATAVASAPLAWACLALGAAAVGFEEAAFTDPAAALAAGDPALVRLSWYCDVLGFYLLIVPSTLALRRWLAARTALADAITFAGLGYSLVGATGAAIHAGATAWLTARWDLAGEAERATLVVLFQLVQAVVNFGIWQYGSMTLGGLFWLGAGLWLARERRALGVLGLLAGGVSLLVPIGGLLGVEPLWSTALVTYFLLAPVFAVALGVRLLRGGL